MYMGVLCYIHTHTTYVYKIKHGQHKIDIHYKQISFSITHWGHLA